MAVTFSETVRDDGSLQVDWRADTTREWQRVRHAVRELIPSYQRKYLKEEKAWVIAAGARPIYEQIKQAATETSDEELLEPFDSKIDQKLLLNAYDSQLPALPKPMQERAAFAIQAAMGLIDVPVAYSATRNAFGAWNDEEGAWLYTDGRFSRRSPAEWDQIELDRAHGRIAKAHQKLAAALQKVDEPDPAYAKAQFRIETLERYKQRCYVCGTRPDDLRRLHMHRVMPGWQGGEYTADNVVLLCASCHRKLEGLSWQEIEAARRQHEEPDCP